MNNDLISREALKKALTSDTRNKYVFVCLSRVLETIDNAPPIEYTFEEAFQKTVCENRLYCPARPQGEWIFRQGTTCGGYYKCSECGEVERAEKNFCPNCGAKMDGGEEE